MQPQQPNPQAPQELNPVVAQAFQPAAPNIAPQPMAPMPTSMIGAQKSHKSSLIVTLLLVTLLVISLGFGGWSFMEMLTYKNKSDKLSAVAVEKALSEQKKTLDAAYVEQSKQPFDTYSGPASSGSIKLVYPRTWSAYVTESDNGGDPVVGYVHPGFVPNIQNTETAFALRIEVVNIRYEEVMKQYESGVTQGAVKVEPYSFPQVKNSLGSKLTGAIKPGSEKLQGTMVLMPVRDKTIKLWTESNSAFGADYTNSVLPNFTFVP